MKNIYRAKASCAILVRFRRFGDASERSSPKVSECNPGGPTCSIKTKPPSRKGKKLGLKGLQRRLSGQNGGLLLRAAAAPADMAAVAAAATTSAAAANGIWAAVGMKASFPWPSVSFAVAKCKDVTLGVIKIAVPPLPWPRQQHRVTRSEPVQQCPEFSDCGYGYAPDFFCLNRK